MALSWQEYFILVVLGSFKPALPAHFVHDKYFSEVPVLSDTNCSVICFSTVAQSITFSFKASLAGIFVPK